MTMARPGPFNVYLGIGIKSDSLWGPSEIEKMWHKVGKMDPLIFRPEITYGMLRIVI